MTIRRGLKIVYITVVIISNISLATDTHTHRLIVISKKEIK